MAVYFVQALLVGCLLYVCCSFGDASLARVSLQTTEIVQQIVASHLQKNVGGSGKEARVKREVVKKNLEDPKGCLGQCSDNETVQLTKVVLKNTARLIALALEDIEIGGKQTPEKEAAFKKKVEDKVIANMGPLFEDLCKIHKTTGLCNSKCPDSQAKTIVGYDNEESQAALCEPSRNWNNFTEYWAAINCTNNTESEKPCDKKCGPDLSMNNETKLSVQGDSDFSLSGGSFSLGDDEDDDDKKSAEKSDDDKKSSDSISVKYEMDSKLNTAAANRVCKTLTCQLDCYKPIMTQKCGAKAYEMYARMSKLEPHSALGILKTLKAIDQANDCKQYA